MRLITVFTCTFLLALLAAFSQVDARPVADTDDEGFQLLFNGRNFDGLKKFLKDKDADPEATWSIKDGVIICTGKPHGYFYTEKSYKNCVIRYDWRYARPKDLKDDKEFKGNSGLLIFITGEHKVWPKCVEVQGMNAQHGKILNVSGAKGKYTFDMAARDKAVKPVGEWNTTEVTCQDGDIVAKINGTEVSRGKSELMEGLIGFQSEGAEIHFRNIKIKETK